MITINIGLAKKLPIQGRDYSTQNASISISGEVTDLSKISDEAAKLFNIAETAVDAQLHIASTPVAPSPDSKTPQSQRPTSPPPAPSNARSYSRSNRKTLLVTSSQLTLIQRLLHSTNTDVGAVLQHFEIGRIDDLSINDASILIDDLKNRQNSQTRS